MTSSERAQHVAELVKLILDRPGEEAQSFLDEACAGDAEMRAEVDSLLKFQARASGFIEQSALNVAAEALAQDGSLAGEQIIGGYKILSKIGAGGMGDVYLAEDIQLRRKVALKLVRAAMSTDDIVARFRHEEQILASLNDPNIAHLYGGGVTANGIPFFAMEYIEGLRIDQYCDRHGLTIADRLKLFRKVCSAVHYAHQHLVIHRDLKPSNILVTEAGEPKLLDFGIAKLLKADEAAPAVTLAGVMTPDYASPEQVRGESITTASDVYSLGVVFYRLLTGQSPYRVKTNRPDEISRAITEQEPTRPSTASVKSDSQNPQSAIRNPKFLKGDLDNIALMALRKDPARRYASVAQFSEDIRRHLDGLPVIARKDTFAYRTSKFIKRNPFRVAAAALLLFSLVGGIITTTWQAQAARRERVKAEGVKNALVRMLNYSRPTSNSGQYDGQKSGKKTVREILDEAAKGLENGEFASQPEIRVELEQILASCYYGQGDLAASSKHSQVYLDLHRKLYGESGTQTLIGGNRAAVLFGQGKLTESERNFRKILPLMRSEMTRGNVGADVLADNLSTFGYLRRTQGDSKEAESLFREALALSPQIPKESIFAMGPLRSVLASSLADQGRFEEALETAREAVTEYLEQQSESATLAFGLTVLGGFLTEMGDYAEADQDLSQAETIDRKTLVSSSLWLGDTLRNQAISFYLQGRYAESLGKITETLKIYRESFGPHYDHYPTALIIQGLILTKTGQPKEGEVILREAVKIRTNSLPKEHYWVALANSALGECLTLQQRYGEAEPLLLASYETLKNSQGANNPRTRLAAQRVIELYQKWQKPDLATKYRAIP